MSTKRTANLSLLAIGILLLFLMVSSLPLFAGVEDFVSGSDGTDGALDLTGQKGTIIFDPSNFPGDQHDRNIMNFTYIKIPAEVTLRVSAKFVSGPMYWLASGDVDIEGTIDASGQAGVPPSVALDGRRRATDPGAGGYDGGMGGVTDGTKNPNLPLPKKGDGPGGGAKGYVDGNNCLWAGAGGAFSGSTLLVPLVGGGGGGGGIYWGNPPTPYGGSGGAGGGGLLIASTATITVNGTINANGGNGGTRGGGGNGNCTRNDNAGYGGGGSGGGIRLAAKAISGTGKLTTTGGAGYGYTGAAWGTGGNGVVRLEAFSITYTGQITGTTTTGTPYASFLMLPTTPPPTIEIVSVDTQQINQPPTGSLQLPDATINTVSQSTITVQAAYIPVGTVLTLLVSSDNETDQAVQTTPLQGTLQQSTATATVTFPTGYSLNYVKAQWTTQNQMRRPRQ